MDHIHNIVHVNINGEMSVMNDFDEFYTITNLSENIFRQHTDRIVNYKNKNIDIIMKQTSCTMEEALYALNKNDNDIVNAIMYVQGY
jgi:NACalpha-BTF3-like transcription factor